jgi:hypothetical protein
MSVRASAKAARFTESVIREMTRLAHQHGAVNLSQGFPDFAAPAELKAAEQQAVAADVNQYAITWGARRLREAIARTFTERYGVPVDPERDVTVTCGSTEAIVAALLAILDPGDETIVFFDPRPDDTLSRETTLEEGFQFDLNASYGVTPWFSLQLDASDRLSLEVPVDREHWRVQVLVHRAPPCEKPGGSADADSRFSL